MSPAGSRRWWPGGQQLGKTVLVLSGEYGLLGPGEEIEWYDRQATDCRKTSQPSPDWSPDGLAAENADRVIFYAEPIDTLGWRPHHNVITAACANFGITLEVELVS